MMAICTELRIPLFVVGKPGSSKSLAKDVISTNMKAGNSESELFKNLKQVPGLFTLIDPIRLNMCSKNIMYV